MKNNFLKTICAGLFIILSFQIHAKTITSRFSQYELGAWAYRQHIEISELILPAILNKKLKAMSYDGKPLAADEGHKFFEEEVVAFISTANDDPTIGYDTTVIAPISEPFYSFEVYKTRIDVKTRKKCTKNQF